ncbi:MAG: hypothetical protein PVJ49_18895 [Acidobacteriota bacterium]|jgi:hypothetical protein
MRALPVLTLVGLLTLMQGSGMAAEQRPARAEGGTTVRAALDTIPPRPADAPGGSEFVLRIAELDRAGREAAILAEVLRGNIPDFLRSLKPITLRGRVGGRAMTIVVWVMPDYLAVGSDDDFVRVPVDYYSALRIARGFAMSLPTRKIVDAVYAQSEVHLTPQPMTPGPRMTSAQYFLAHNERIERQWAEHTLGELVAGHKKDLVITNRLQQQRTRRVAIYGWHRAPGDPIQPLSLVHGATYADYSHGLRLVSDVLTVNGVERPLLEVLQDARLGPILTREGTIQVPSGLLPAR